ncbi:MAG: Na(+)-translocating NADH-quinone reductase subunit C [Methylococcales bacterium]|nr:Na(+)-translocating NADH-quinone reductase subunit C [Methylococcales bacterium]
MPNDNVKSDLKQQFKAYAEKILAMGNDQLEKTLMVALALSLACAVLVSLSAVALKPLQEANKALDMRGNILDVAGLLKPGTDINQAFEEQIEAKLVDLDTGEYVDNIDVNAYDQREAKKDPKSSVAIPAAQDIAKIKRKAKIAKIYLVKQGEDLKSIILPVSGYGLWSTMYGFLAIEPDGQTVQSINFYDQAETPGLGGEVVNPNWRALWQGKKIYTSDGEPVLHLVKGSVDPDKPGSEHKVDALAGATLTSVGVTNLIQFWLGDQGFARYLQKVRVEG